MAARRSLECPYCETTMRPVKAECPECRVSVEADFRLPRVAWLPPEEAEFLAEYVLAGFQIKDLEKRIGMSYPAVRARLDRVQESMRRIAARGQTRGEVLDRLEKGEIAADEAAEMIAKL